LTLYTTLRNPAYMPIPTVDAEAVAATIRSERAKRGWSQQQLAVKADVSRRTIVAAENCEYGINDWTYGLIAKALDVSLPWLLGREE